MNVAFKGTTLLLFVLAVFPCMGVENPKKPEAKPLFTWDLNWTGSWYKNIKIPKEESLSAEDFFSGGTLYNRANVSLGIPRLDLSFRFLATDKRLMPPQEDDGKAGFNPGAGIYHYRSGSRLIYGAQNEYGLPARIRNVWLRSVPFMETRSPSSRDLKAEPSAQDKAETYIYLALPPIQGLSAFASAALDKELNPAFGAGFALGLAGWEMRLEGFYTGKTLAQRKISTWFSSSPPLPERDFDIYAMGMIFSRGSFAFATDWALSETFAWGRDIYGNAALRIGNKPWRFSLAGDGAGRRFTDRNGSMTGSGFRIASKLERFWPRSGLLRFQGTISSPGPEEDFDRGSFSIYFRPPAPSAAERRNNPRFFRFSRASLSFGRDARKPEKANDSLDAMAAFSLGPFSTILSCALDNNSCLDDAGKAPPLLRLPLFEIFDSFKVSAELGWKPGIFDFVARVGYTIRAEKENLWNLSFNCSVRPAKWGRLGLKIASSDFPDKWEYTVSWRLEGKGDWGLGTGE